jgi:hypothetical protein
MNPKCVCGHPSCASGTAEVRCIDCDGCEMLAVECMVREHERSPLHRIEVFFLSLRGYESP